LWIVFPHDADEDVQLEFEVVDRFLFGLSRGSF